MKKLLIFFVLLFFVSGCSVGGLLISPIATGVIMWKDGLATKYYNEQDAVIYRSTKAALKELNLPIMSEELQKGGSYYIVAGDNDRFKITIKKINSNITLISIRVNFMGDKPFAEIVYKTIDGQTDTIDFVDGRPLKIKIPAK